MFQILVENDWNSIADVFITPTNISAYANYANMLVYPFFIFVLLINGTILFNVITAFFVGAFVINVDKSTESLSVGNDTEALSDSSSHSASNKTIASNHSERMALIGLSTRSYLSSSGPDDSIITMQKSERQSFSSIMHTVAGEE